MNTDSLFSKFRAELDQFISDRVAELLKEQMAEANGEVNLTKLALDNQEDLFKAWKRSSKLLHILANKAGGGPNASVVEVDQLEASSFEEGADFDEKEFPDYLVAVLPWGSVKAEYAVSGSAKARAGSLEGTKQLHLRQLINAAEAVARVANDGIVNGTGEGGSIIGLGEAIGSAKNTYAGIDRSNPKNAFWRPNVTSSKGALTFSLIRNDLAGIYMTSGMRPQIAAISASTESIMKSLFDPQKACFTYNNIQGGIEFDGCVFIVDRSVKDGVIHYINTDFVEVKFLPSKEGHLENMLGFRAEHLNKTGDSDRAFARTYAQLVVTRPNSCGTRYFEV